jgi:hypothetical protein
VTDKPKNPLLSEKQAMFAKQADREERAKPLSNLEQVGYARALLLQLDKRAMPPSPARITMSGPPPLANDRIESSAQPEPIGGCFSDLVDEDA